jgi:hypothetical protein
VGTWNGRTSPDFNLSYVIDVEQAGSAVGRAVVPPDGTGTSPRNGTGTTPHAFRGVMFFERTGGVLHRHLPAGESDHAGTMVHRPLV